MKITVDVTQLTLGDLEDLEAGKISSLVSILTKFSDLTREEVRAIPVDQIVEIGEELNAAIEKEKAKAVPFETSGSS